MIETCFESVDTVEKAYWLGFLYADGCVNASNNGVVIELSHEDEEILHSFCSFICIDSALIKNIIKPGIKRLVIHNKTLKADLINWGCISNKSKSIRLPNLPNEKLYSTFLLGYFDGDGCLYKYRGSELARLYSGSDLFLEDIKGYFKLKGTVTLKLNHWGSCYKLTIPASLLYEASLLYPKSLERKKVRKLKKRAELSPSEKQIIRDLKLNYGWGNRRINAATGIPRSTIKDFFNKAMV